MLFFLVPLGILILYALNCIKILREYERGVIFSLGRLQQDAKGPGLIFVFAPGAEDGPHRPAAAGA